MNSLISEIDSDNKTLEGAEVFTKASLSALPPHGDTDAFVKFLDRLSSLIDKPDPKGQHLIEYLLEIVLDNKLMEVDPAMELVANNGKTFILHYLL